MTKILQTARKVLEKLPVFSLLNYTYGDQIDKDSSTKRLIKGFGHLFYACATVFALSYEIKGFCETGKINPREIKQYHIQTSELSERLFSPNGLADTNKDGIVDFNERAEAYRRMGLESQVQFPQPKLEQLEKAVNVNIDNY